MVEIKDNIRERSVTIEAKPEAIRIDTSRTAIIVVDMQNDSESTSRTR